MSRMSDQRRRYEALPRGRRKPLDPGPNAGPGAKGSQRYGYHPVIGHSVPIETAGWYDGRDILDPQTGEMAGQEIFAIGHRQSLQIMVNAPRPATPAGYTARAISR